MISVSLCMIVKNEEDVLARCLDSVASLVDEIIIVDTGSTDQTKFIASQYTQRVYDFEWVDDFSAARNFAFSLASCSYCMWLDADDIITPPNRQLFMDMKRTLSDSISVVMMPYHTQFDDEGNVTFSYYRERLVRNFSTMRWVGAVHEVIDTSGTRFYAPCAITHKKLHPSDPDRNLRIFQRLLAQGVALDPRQQFYYGRELYYHQRYQQALDVFQAFLNNPSGWLENRIDALCQCAYCHYQLGQEEQGLYCLLHTLALDLPRAEVCCDIGKHFFDRAQWRNSAFWYTIATTCHRDDTRGGFTIPDCYGYLPCIQLCVCYSRMGQLEQAQRFNELAAQFKPNAPAVEQNRAYFSQILASPQRHDAPSPPEEA